MSRYCIVIFCYNRPDRLTKLLNSLRNQKLQNFEINIFSDGSKSKYDFSDVASVRKIIAQNSVMFKSISLREKNLGLRESVIQGCGMAAENYDGFVVLEDDLVLSPSAMSYLEYMLDNHSDRNDIGHINLWSLPGLVARSAYFTAHMNCWGWATWSKHWDSELIEIVNLKLTLWQRIKLSKFFSTTHYSHLYANKHGIRNTWAVLWMVSLQARNLRIVAPPVSLCLNDGFQDGTHYEDVYENIGQASIDLVVEKIPREVRNNGLNDFKSWLYSIYYTPKLSLSRSIYLILVGK